MHLDKTRNKRFLDTQRPWWLLFTFFKPIICDHYTIHQLASADQLAHLEPLNYALLPYKGLVKRVGNFIKNHLSALWYWIYFSTFMDRLFSLITFCIKEFVINSRILLTHMSVWTFKILHWIIKYLGQM